MKARSTIAGRISIDESMDGEMKGRRILIQQILRLTGVKISDDGGHACRRHITYESI